MTAKINCFIPFQDNAQVQGTVNGLKQNDLVGKIYLLASNPEEASVEGCEVIAIDSLNSTATIKKIAEKSDAQFSLFAQ